MPKGWGVNAKKEEARERNEQKKRGVKEAETRRKEDEAWRETDPKVLAKEAKKREAEEKERARARVQQEKKALYEQEQEEAAKAKLSLDRTTKKLLKEMRVGNGSSEAKSSFVGDLPPTAVASKSEQPSESSVEDKHPEKRVAAAWERYKESRLETLKSEHPGLKLSQYNERLWKEFSRSPDNPLNNPSNKAW